MNDKSEQENNARDFGDLRRAVVATFSSSMARIVARVMLILFVVKLYGVGNFGYLGEVAATVELLAAVATVGLPKTIMAYLERYKLDQEDSANLVANAISLTAIMGIILGGSLFVAIPFVFPSSSYVPSYVAAAICIISFTEILLTLTRSQRIIRWEAMVKGLVKPWSFFLLAMIGYFIFVVQLGFRPMHVLIGAYSLSLILAAGVALYGFGLLLRSNKLSIGTMNFRAVFALAKESAPTAIVDAASFGFRRLDIIILGWMTGSNVTGVYYLGQQLATVVGKLRHLFEPMVAPILAQTQSLKTIETYLQKTCRWIFAANIGVGIVFALFAVPIMALFDINFAMAGLLMAILLFGELIDGTTGLVELPIVFRDPIFASRNVVITLILEGLIVYIGVYNLGIIGAAIGFALGMTMLGFLRLWTVRKLYNLNIIDRSYVKPVIAGGLAIAIILISRDFLLSFGSIGLVSGVLLCGGFYILALRIMGISMRISDNS